MNAISVFFPQVCNLLCHFHINMNVKVMCKMLVDYVEAWEVIMDVKGFSLVVHVVMNLRVVLNVLKVFLFVVAIIY